MIGEYVLITRYSLATGKIKKVVGVVLGEAYKNPNVYTVVFELSDGTPIRSTAEIKDLEIIDPEEYPELFL